MPQAKTSLVGTLKKVPLFNDLAEEDHQFLLRHGLRHHVKAHEFIFSEGQVCRGLYLIEAGSVKIFGSSMSGREQILATQGPGGTLGELAVLDGGNHPASAIASTDADLLLIRTEDLQALVLQHPAVRVKLLELVASRVRPMIDIVKQLSFTTVRQRLAGFLLRLAEKDGTPTAHGVEFTLTCTHRDLAAQIGTVPELVSRNLGYLQASGLIKVRGKTVIISKPKSLQLEAES
jgi:CRP/FNR family transcriptional regulator, dissimilatory nitrate respiration regulator